MMHDHKFALVPFHGQQLTSVEVGGQLHIAVKPVCDAIGLDWSAQFRRIKRDTVLSTCVAITAMQVPGEIQKRDVLTIPLSHLNGFLFGISAARLSGEAKNRLIVYQQECYRVLHDYWMKGTAVNPRANAGHIGNTDTILKLTKAIQSEKSEHVRQMMHKLLQQECEQRGIIAPEVAEIGGPNTGQWQITFNRFRAALNLLIGAGEQVDLHRRDDRMALNLPDLAKLARKHRIDMPPLTEIYDCLRAWPGLVSQGDVNCSDGKVRHCWVISLRGVADLIDDEDQS